MISYFTINKNVYYDTIKNSFKHQNELLEQVKLDFNRMDVYVNSDLCESYCQLLEFIKRDHEEYLEKILLLCNQCAHFYSYNQIFSIINRENLHLTSNIDKRNLYTTIQLTPLIKQVCIFNSYDILDEKEEYNKIRSIKVTTIVDLTINDPITIKIEYLE